MKRRDMQTKITQRLQIIPRNRQILLEKQMEKERLMYLKEAKEEIWKKCLPLKIIFHPRLYSIKGHLPSKVIFHQKMSFIKGHIPSKVASI